MIDVDVMVWGVSVITISDVCVMVIGGRVSVTDCVTASASTVRVSRSVDVAVIAGSVSVMVVGGVVSVIRVTLFTEFKVTY